MNYLTHALREHQELAVFLTLAIGFFIGRVKIGSFSLGTVVGTLLAGVAIGQLNIQVPAVVRYVFFDLFLFTTGYKVGPQFFRALKKDALPQLALTLVLCVTCLLAAFTAALRAANHTLKRSLTDPRVLSGIGNAYSDEILHAAQLSPIAQTQKLTHEEWERLYEATQATRSPWSGSSSARRTA